MVSFSSSATPSSKTNEKIVRRGLKDAWVNNSTQTTVENVAADLVISWQLSGRTEAKRLLLCIPAEIRSVDLPPGSLLKPPSLEASLETKKTTQFSERAYSFIIPQVDIHKNIEARMKRKHFLRQS